MDRYFLLYQIPFQTQSFEQRVMQQSAEEPDLMEFKEQESASDFSGVAGGMPEIPGGEAMYQVPMYPVYPMTPALYPRLEQAPEFCPYWMYPTPYPIMAPQPFPDMIPMPGTRYGLW